MKGPDTEYDLAEGALKEAEDRVKQAISRLEAARERKGES